MLPPAPLSMVSPGQEAQNIHAHPSKGCPCLSSNPTGPSRTSFCWIVCTLGPSRPSPVSPLLCWVLPPGLCSCQALSGHLIGSLSECWLLLAWCEACLVEEALRTCHSLSCAPAEQYVGPEMAGDGVPSPTTPTPRADPRRGPLGDSVPKCSQGQLRTHCVLASDTRACQDC